MSDLEILSESTLLVDLIEVSVEKRDLLKARYQSLFQRPGPRGLSFPQPGPMASPLCGQEHGLLSQQLGSGREQLG